MRRPVPVANVGQRVLPVRSSRILPGTVQVQLQRFMLMAKAHQTCMAGRKAFRPQVNYMAFEVARHQCLRCHSRHDVGFVYQSSQDTRTAYGGTQNKLDPC